MKERSKYNIKSKFLFLYGIVLFAFIILAVFTAISVKNIRDYGNESSNLLQIRENFLKMKFIEKDFLLNYKDDIHFFATGKNTSVNELKDIEKKTTSLINDLKKDDYVLALVEYSDLEDIQKDFTVYLRNFEKLTVKIRERGVGSSGLVARLNEAHDNLISLNNDEVVTGFIAQLVQAQSKYHQTYNTQNYAEFSEKYEELIAYLGEKNSDVAEIFEQLEDTTYVKEDSLNISETGILFNLDENVGVVSQLDDSLNTETQIEDSSNSNLYEALSTYHGYFETIVSIDSEIGLSDEAGLKGQLKTAKNNLDDLLQEMTSHLNPRVSEIVSRKVVTIILLNIILVILLWIIMSRFAKSLITPIEKIKSYINILSKGNLPEEKIVVNTKDEIADIAQILQNLVVGLKKTTEFASAIGKNDFGAEFNPLSDEDALGTSLLEMRNSLKKAMEDETERKLLDEKQNWSTRGISKFNDILRQNNDNLEELSYQVISNIIDYLKANQGGIFLFNKDDDEEPYLEMVASFAYDRRKFLTKRVAPGEGLVGTCALEKKTIYLTKLPDEYIKITSGLGKSNPNSLFIVPMKMEDSIMGVIEIASFKEFEKHEIEFIEKLADTVASTLATVKINQRTNRLLDESKIKSEAMAAQEEEMRQNMEEVQATQEEMERKQNEVGEVNRKLKDNETKMSAALEVARKTESDMKRKNEEILRREREVKLSLEKMETTQQELLQQKENLEGANKKLHTNENILRKTISKTQEKDKKITELRRKFEESEMKVSEYEQKLASVREMLKFKDDEIERLRNEK